MTRFFFPANRAHHAYAMALDLGMEFATRFGKWPTEGLLHVTGKLYVHPDSFELLVPIKGDIIHEPDGPLQILDICSYSIARYRAPCGDWKCGASLQEEIFGISKRIIQRNGKPFFWPDCETE